MPTHAGIGSPAISPAAHGDVNRSPTRGTPGVIRREKEIPFAPADGAVASAANATTAVARMIVMI